MLSRSFLRQRWVLCVSSFGEVCRWQSAVVEVMIIRSLLRQGVFLGECLLTGFTFLAECGGGDFTGSGAHGCGAVSGADPCPAVCAGA